MNIKLIDTQKDDITIVVSGRIDTDTESDLEKFIFSIKSLDEKKVVILDFLKVEYISSAGLRLLLRIMKSGKKLQIVNVSHDVYDIFEMTGFTDLCSIQKVYRQVNVTGCKVIGAGANGIVFRLDSERILKLYTKPNVLDSIITEKANAKYAFLLGIPTAISFDIVKVGEQFGSVFELLEAQSVASLITQNPETLDKYIVPYTKLIKTLHSIDYVEKDSIKLIPFIERFNKYVSLIKENYGEELYQSLVRFVADIPECKTMLHGDCHPFNVMNTREGMVFIDMDTLTYGNPVFDLGSLYSTIIGLDQFVLQERRLYKCSTEVTKALWDKTFNEYYKDVSEEEKSHKHAMCKVIGCTQILAFCIKHPDLIIDGKTKVALHWLEKAISEYF